MPHAAPRARRTVAVLLGPLAGLALADPAAAHAGTAHGGTPHTLLLVLAVAGLLTVVGSAAAVGRGRLGLERGAPLAFLGLVALGGGGVALVENQVVAESGPASPGLYPLASAVAGSAIMLGSLAVVRRRWPRRPRYAALGALLGAWVAYPGVLPNGGVSNPLGYALAVGLPVAVAYVCWRDARGALGWALARPAAAGAGLLVGVLSAVFLAFSAGTLTLSPDEGVNAPTEPVVTTLPVVDPLVYWPAVEFAFPSVPVAGVVSVGTVLLLGLLGTLIGLNVATVVAGWRAGVDVTTSRPLSGALGASGATACCCCAPAMYGALSALTGAAATPVYWAFMDTSSPLGALFLAGSVVLLIGSLVGVGSRPAA